MKLVDLLKEGGRICWYPSAGTDLKPLLYLSQGYSVKHGLQTEEGPLEAPDIFLYTDCDPQAAYPYDRNFGEMLGRGYFKPGEVLFEDLRTRIRVASAFRLEALSLEKPEGLYHFQFPADYGTVYCLNLQIHSKTFAKTGELTGQSGLGDWEIKLVYCITENTVFARDVLVQHKIPVDCVTMIRYGEAFGGSELYPGWIRHILGQLGTRYCVENDGYALNCRQPEPECIAFWPEIGEYSPAKLLPFYRIDGANWSDYGQIWWTKVCQTDF